MKTLFLMVVPALSLMDFCTVDPGIGMGDGQITVHNADDGTHEVTVSDTPDCVVGMKGELRGDTTRTYDIAEEGAFMCIGDSGGVRVENGRRYTVRGGALGAEL